MSPEPAPFIPPSSEEHSFPPAPWRLFGTRPFFKLWLAQVFSSLGDWVGLFAILGTHRAASRTTRPPRSASSSRSRMVPGFFLATLGGVIVDRFDRRKVMVLLRPRARRADLARCPFVRQPLAARARLVLHRDPHAALGAGEGRVGAALRARGEARVRELAVARRVLRHVPARRASITAALGGRSPAGSAGSTRWRSLKVDKAIPALWFDAITYVVSAIIVFGLPIPRRPKQAGPEVRLDVDVPRDQGRHLASSATDRFARAVIVGLGGGVIGAGAMVPLEPRCSRPRCSGSKSRVRRAAARARDRGRDRGVQPARVPEAAAARHRVRVVGDRRRDLPASRRRRSTSAGSPR